MNSWLWSCIAVSSLGFFAAVHAQQTAGGPPSGQAPGYRQRLDTIVRADTVTNQPPGNYDPLAFYRKNPELMRRYFPHLFAGEAGAGAPVPQANNQGKPDTIVLDSFEFPGGNAVDLANMLKETLNPPPNIIVAPKLRETEIPEFELKNITLPDLFQALNNLSEDKSIQWQLSGSTEPIWVLNPAPGTVSAPNSGFGFNPGAMVDPVTGMPLPANNGRVCQILPLGKFLKDYKVEDITTAVKTAWSMMGDDAGAQLKYHTDTKLLIAVGTSPQLNILMQVLSSLESGMSAGTSETKAAGEGRSSKF